MRFSPKTTAFACLLAFSLLALSACQAATPTPRAGIPTPPPPIANLQDVQPTLVSHETPAPVPNGLTGALLYYGPDKSNQYQIFTVVLPAEKPTQLTQTGENIDPAWSPDGKQIAYACKTGNVYQLCVMDANGANSRQITNDTYNDWSPRWSPDGKQILYLSNQVPYAHLYLMDLAGGAPRRLVNSPGNEGAATWLPDGSRIIFMSDRKGFNLFSVKPDGSDEQQLTQAGGDDRPSISADGKRLTFRRQVVESTFFSGSEIMVMDLDGKNLLQLTHNTLNNNWPAFSPDGKWIVYSTGMGDSDYLRIVPVGGGLNGPLTNFDLIGRGPTWKP